MPSYLVDNDWNPMPEDLSFVRVEDFNSKGKVYYGKHQIEYSTDEPFAYVIESKFRRDFSTFERIKRVITAIFQMVVTAGFALFFKIFDGESPLKLLAKDHESIRYAKASELTKVKRGRRLNTYEIERPLFPTMPSHTGDHCGKLNVARLTTVESGKLTSTYAIVQSKNQNFTKVRQITDQASVEEAFLHFGELRPQEDIKPSCQIFMEVFSEYLPEETVEKLLRSTPQVNLSNFEKLSLDNKQYILQTYPDMYKRLMQMQKEHVLARGEPVAVDLSGF